MRSRVPALAAVLAAITLLGVLPAEARPRRNSRIQRSARVVRDVRPGSLAAAQEVSRNNDGSQSISIGKTNRGRLMHAVEMRESSVIRFKARNLDQRFGTAELVAAMERAATRVAERYPGSKLTVGDLSQQFGGRYRPHRSHRNGRDIDIGFYMTNLEGTPVYRNEFISMNGDGRPRPRRRGEAPGPFMFDDARNWAFVEALVTDPVARMQYMFVSRGVQNRILAEGARQGASAEILQRAQTVMYEPSRGSPHRDHFHIRVYCAPDDIPACIDEPPFHAWVAPATRTSELQARAD